MKSDINGCSTCPVGAEQYEYFNASWADGAERVQYDYRAKNRRLFSCIAPSLEEARGRRDRWLETQSELGPLEPIDLDLTADQMTALRLIADRDGTSVDEVVERAIREGLDARRGA